MKYKSVLLGLFLCLAATPLWAHALWIETNAEGKKGVPQEVRVFFGEYSDKDITPVAKWFSDTREFSLVVIAPSGKQTPLKASAATDYYTASFIPGEEGEYVVVMHHIVKELYHGSRLDYNSSAIVKVGPATGSPKPNPNVISVRPLPSSFTQNTPLKIEATLDGQAAAKKEVEIIAPNGWTKKLYTDSTGTITFTPLWPGKYMVEITSSNKKEGEHNGKKFETDWKCATYVIEIK